MQQRFGDFVLEALVGRGGMAEVYRAKAVRGPLEGRTVAIKRLLPELARDPMFVDLFIMEADVSRRLDHPAIVPVLSTGAVGDLYFIVMEYIDGRDLGQLLRMCAEREIMLPIDLACHVVCVLAQALHHAHEAKSAAGQPLGIVHCDVTPSNVFISALGEVRLGDFGVAQAQGLETARERQFIAGKVAYMAPEQIEGEPVSAATDVFALGAILFEMLTSQHAFTGRTQRELMAKIVEGSVPRPSSLRQGISTALDEVVLTALTPRREAASGLGGTLRKALSGRPAQRYESAARLAEALTPLYDPAIGTDLAMASVLRGMFGAAYRR